VLSIQVSETTSGQSYEGIRIGDVKIELENRTGTFHFLFHAEGTSPEWTEHVNATFGFSNSTSREILDFWIEPVDLVLFGNGIKLVPTGGGDDNWTTWKLEIMLNVPMGEDPGFVLALITGIFGVNMTGIEDLIDLENITGSGDLTSLEGVEELLNLTGISSIENLTDPVELLKLLSETELLIVARGVDEDGIYTEDEKDIKFELIGAIFGFLEAEGIIEGVDDIPPVDDDDTSDNGEEEENDNLTLIYVMGGISMLLILGILILLLMILMMKRREKPPFNPFIYIVAT
jgi:hypothetical protein